MSGRQRLEVAAWIGMAALLVLWPVKFGNPENPNFAPLPDAGGLWSLALGPWPIEWGYAATFLLGVASLAAAWPARGARWQLYGVEVVFVLWLAWMATAGWLATIYRYATLRFLLLTGAGLAAWGLGRRWSIERERRPVLLGALYLGTVLVTISAVQQRVWGLSDLREYVAQHGGMEVLPPLMQWKLMSNRTSGPLINPNMLAGFLLAAVPLSGWWMAGVLQARWRRGGSGVWLALACLPGAVSLALSQSKAGVLSLFVAGAVASWLALAGRWRRWLLLLAVLMAALGAALVLTFGRSLLERGQMTGQARVDYWSAAVRIGLERPVWGTGPATFGLVHPAHKLAGTEETQTAHNLLLQALADSGLPGLILAAVLMGWVLLTLCAAVRVEGQERRQQEREEVEGGSGRENGREGRELRGEGVLFWVAGAGCGAWWLHNLGDFHWFVPGDAHVALWVTGFLVGAARVGPRLALPARPAAAGVAAGLLLLLVVAWREGQAEALTRGGVRALAEGHAPAPAALLERAAALSPGNAEIHRLRARALAGQGAWGEALAAYERALALCPLRSGLHMEIGQYLWAHGARVGRTREAALAHLRRAVELYPTKAVYHRRLAECLREVGQDDAAALHSRRAEELGAVPDPLVAPEVVEESGG